MPARNPNGAMTRIATVVIAFHSTIGCQPAIARADDDDAEADAEEERHHPEGAQETGRRQSTPAADGRPRAETVRGTHALDGGGRHHLPPLLELTRYWTSACSCCFDSAVPKFWGITFGWKPGTM